MDSSEIFLALTGKDPFPWQDALLEAFLKGELPEALDIPTGLGKTSVMAIWLVALSRGARVPRKLVYIVDRRAVVDQATETAMKLKDVVDANVDFQDRLRLNGRLPISTLRGKHVDNREWLQDPVSPAIIVGTVDMIGSRLLFEGYGISRKMRPYHAGLLGSDALIVLDEAHLVPAFERLLEQIANPDGDLNPVSCERRKLVPELKLLSLSATGRANKKAFTLTKADELAGSIPYQRLTAVKRLRFEPLQESEKLFDALARHAWALVSNGDGNPKVVVFSNAREVSVKAREAVEKRAKGDKREGSPEIKIDCQMLVGERRVRERELVSDWLKNHGFLADSPIRPEHPTLVFATSAGEVGIDLDADHLVCDLVSCERMVQRLGRVNRRGEGRAKVIVVTEPAPKPSKAAQKALEKSPDQRDKNDQEAVRLHEDKVTKLRALAKVFDLLPYTDEGIDVSPGALRILKLSAGPMSDDEGSAADPVERSRREILAAATSPAPLYPVLSRALVDAWSMTSLFEHTGRPRIQPWLRGWLDEEPQTSILWRTHLPLPTSCEGLSKRIVFEIESFFEAAPPHTSEMLEAEIRRVLPWLLERAEIISKLGDSTGGGMKSRQDDPLRPNQPCAIVLENDGKIRKIEVGGKVREAGLCISDLLLSKLDKKASDRREEELGRYLAGGILVLDARFGGLSANGLLDESANSRPPTLDGSVDWLSTEEPPAIRFRVRRVHTDDDGVMPGDPYWSLSLSISIRADRDGEPTECLLVEKWRGEIETSDDATAPSEQHLDDHQILTAKKARAFAIHLGLPPEYIDMLECAARLHDEGKRHEKWQDAFSAPREGRPFAKTRGPINQALLDGYRHEFASVAAAAKDAALGALSPELRELALHLITAHHGFGRPVISPRGCPDAPPSILEDRAREAALRFARLQRRWGPWGLAWWESLLRAADQHASRDIEPKAEETSAVPSYG